jgi:hypothetical protein
MGRSYHVEIAALIAGTGPKWIDNLLSHFELPGVESARQGVARRISLDGLRHISLVKRLTHDLGVPISRAVDLAARLLADPNSQVDASESLRLGLDRSGFDAELADRVAEAVETTAPARRGRRPARSAANDQ